MTSWLRLLFHRPTTRDSDSNCKRHPDVRGYGGTTRPTKKKSDRNIPEVYQGIPVKELSFSSPQKKLPNLGHPSWTCSVPRILKSSPISFHPSGDQWSWRELSNHASPCQPAVSITILQWHLLWAHPQLNHWEKETFHPAPWCPTMDSHWRN